MNILLRKYATGDKFWYSGLNDFDPTLYIWEWNTKAGLKKGDVRKGFLNPWASPTAGLDPGRYTPTDLSPEHGTMGINLNHYTYTKGVEELPYYKDFTEALFDKNNKLTSVGMEYIKLSDALLPEGHNARILDSNGNIKDSITVKLKDAHGRAPLIKTFNLKNPEELKAYINHVRNDQTVGGRHNVFPKVGKRYFYYDDLGTTHWVSPEEALNYEMFDTPEEGYDENGVYWYDYQLKGPKKTAGSSKVDTNHNNKYGFDWDKIRTAAKNILGNPNLLEAGRLAGNLINNERVYDEYLKGITPVLRLTYNTHRQVVGDEATKQAYYRRAAQGETQAAKPFTADADRQVAYMNEAKRIGDDLRALGDLADNQEIRRTSDESNQHQWANILRATEVANANHASIALANASKHALLAQKHSALWSTLDNYLKGIEYRQREKQAKREALQDLYNLIDYQERVSNDPELARLLKEADDAWNTALKAGRTPSTDATVKAKLQALRNYLYGLLKLRILQQIESAKSGTKITTKFTTKQDLLYKSAKDVVEHFLRMSKLSLDAQKIRPPKIEKLTSHPKRSTRKYLLGGTAPFTIFTPVALGGSSTTSTQAESTSATGKSSGKDETLNVIKDLFKELKGLPSDVNGVYAQMSNFLAKAKAFGEEITSDDLASIYLSLMQQINHIKFSKERYDKTAEKVAAREANGEYAIRSDGRFVVQNINTGELGYKTLSELKDSKEFTPITNGLLMQIRALDPSKGFLDDLLQIADNATSMSEIAKFLKVLLPSLGNSEGTIEGYTKKQSNDIVKGLEVLQDAPDGDYKYTKYTKEQQALALLALKYLASILPNNMKALLSIRAYENGTNPSDILASLVNSGVSAASKLEFDAVTGKAAKKDDGTGDPEDGKIKSNPLVAMLREIGGTPQRYTLVTRDSNTGISVNGTMYSALPKVKEDMSLELMLGVSGIDGIVLSKRGITLGDLQIKPEDFKHIMYANNGGIVVTLPCKIVNGVKQVNLDVKDAYERAELAALQKVSDRQDPRFIKVLGLELKKEHLDSLLDSRGLPNKNMFSQFLIVEAYTTDKVHFDKDSQYVEKVSNPEEVEDRLVTALSTDKKKKDYELDIKDWWQPFEMTYDDIYRGNIFIPLNNNINAAINSWGNDSEYLGETTQLENAYLNYNKRANFNSNNYLMPNEE